MSLSSFNCPPLVAALGAGAHLAFPYIQSLPLSYNTLRIANLVSYGINVYAVSQPGRTDGEAKIVDGHEIVLYSPEQGRTLVAPSGWAFAIWAPIYLGELVMVTSQFFIPETSAVSSIIMKISVPFTFANIFQSLWCASFRPKYKGKYAFISAAMLSSIAYSLSKAHATYASEGSYSKTEYCLLFLPLSLHFGWTTAATLVNWNGSVAKQDPMQTSTPGTMAVLGNMSAIVATLLGSYITTVKNAPVYGAVISWALAAVSDGMKKRLKADSASSGDDEAKKKIVGYTLGARPMQLLCAGGAFITGASSLLVVFSSRLKTKL